jgi:glyoxylase-like metal-dependent hydrolase (beta-lactamase superfamily II)
MALHLKWFTFNPFSENTYLLYGDNKDCIILDPGCANESEENTILKFIEEKQLHVSRLILTHAHIDHVLGVRFITSKFKLKLEMHKADLPVYASAGNIAKMYGIPFNQGPEPEIFLDENTKTSIRNYINKFFPQPDQLLNSITSNIYDTLGNKGIEAKVSGRIKSYDSIFGFFKLCIPIIFAS